MKKTTSYNFKGKHNWHLIDAKMNNLGRIATRAVLLLLGKQKVDYAPQVDNGDFVVIMNTQLLKVSHPEKWNKKIYYRYTGYAGGIKKKSLRDLVAQDSNEVLRIAIYNMLPKNKLRAIRINRLKLFALEQEGKELYEAMKKGRK